MSVQTDSIGRVAPRPPAYVALSILVALVACDSGESMNDELSEELALLDDEGSALDPDSLGDLETEAQPIEEPHSSHSDPDLELQAPLDPSLVTIAQDGWAWVTASGGLGAFDVHTGTVTSSRLSTGRYLVDITPSPFMNVQVVAYGSSDAMCKRVGGAGGTGPQISCFDSDGVLVDSAFVIVFQSKSDPGFGKGAYLSSPAVGAATYSWNSTGGTNTVTWDASAQAYDVTLPGMNFYNASVHVTANGYAGDTCRANFWGSGTVRVKCLDSDGAATQSQFALTYNEDTLLLGHAGGHTWVSSGTPSIAYSKAESTICGPAGTFTAASAGLDLDVSLSEPGVPPSSWSSFVPMVSDYGGSDNSCKLVFWSAPGTGYRARVRCFDGDGTQIDASSASFTLTFTHNNYPGPC